jgi:hypothetical protein
MSAPGYRAGDFWRICDVCGFQRRASATFKRWDGLMVCAEDWEPRHPQDFVRGKKDQQNVPDPRPEPVVSIIGPLTTTLAADASAGATTLTVALSTRFLATDTIGITLENGSVFRTTIAEIISSTSLRIATGLPSAAASGGLIINYSAVTAPSL